MIIINNTQNNYHLSFYKKYYKIREIRLEGKIIREISKVVHMSFQYVSRIVKNTLKNTKRIIIYIQQKKI